MKKILTATSISLLPAVSFAHPGHDHGHWTSDLTHSLFFISVLAMVALGVKIVSSRYKANVKKEKN